MGRFCVRPHLVFRSGDVWKNPVSVPLFQYTSADAIASEELNVIFEVSPLSLPFPL